MSNPTLTTTPSLSTITSPASLSSLNRGPLTTFFAPAPTCSQTLSFDGAMYYGFGNKGVYDTACYPMGTEGYADLVAKTRWDLYYYSPAVCPGGWDTVTRFSSAVPYSDEMTFMTVGSDTTAVLCCPSDYSYSYGGHICTSAIKKDQSIDYVSPTTDLAGAFVRGSVTPSIYPSPSLAWANGIIALYQSTDVSLLLTATSPPSSSTSSSTIPSATSPTPTSSTNSNPNPSSSLPTPAKIGIAIGIPLAALLGLALGFLLFRRRRASKAPLPGYHEAGTGTGTGTGTGMVKYAHVEEGAGPVYEAGSEPAEMGVGREGRHELM